MPQRPITTKLVLLLLLLIAGSKTTIMRAAARNPKARKKKGGAQNAAPNFVVKLNDSGTVASTVYNPGPSYASQGLLIMEPNGGLIKHRRTGSYSESDTVTFENVVLHDGDLHLFALDFEQEKFVNQGLDGRLMQYRAFIGQRIEEQEIQQPKLVVHAHKLDVAQACPNGTLEQESAFFFSPWHIDNMFHLHGDNILPLLRTQFLACSYTHTSVWNTDGKDGSRRNDPDIHYTRQGRACDGLATTLYSLKSDAKRDQQRVQAALVLQLLFDAVRPAGEALDGGRTRCLRRLTWGRGPKFLYMNLPQAELTAVVMELRQVLSARYGLEGVGGGEAAGGTPVDTGGRPVPRPVVLDDHSDDRGGTGAAAEAPGNSTTCKSLQEQYGVMPGVTWGKMPQKAKEQWGQLNCDQHAAAALTSNSSSSSSSAQNWVWPAKPGRWEAPLNAVYLHRSISGARGVHSEGVFFAICRRLGLYCDGTPFDYSFSDSHFNATLRRIAQADIVFGPHGAGLTHILYAKPGALLVHFYDSDVRMEAWKPKFDKLVSAIGGTQLAVLMPHSEVARKQGPANKKRLGFDMRICKNVMIASESLAAAMLALRPLDTFAFADPSVNVNGCAINANEWQSPLTAPKSVPLAKKILVTKPSIAPTGAAESRGWQTGFDNNVMVEDKEETYPAAKKKGDGSSLQQNKTDTSLANSTEEGGQAQVGAAEEEEQDKVAAQERRGAAASSSSVLAAADAAQAAGLAALRAELAEHERALEALRARLVLAGGGLAEQEGGAADAAALGAAGREGVEGGVEGRAAQEGGASSVLRLHPQPVSSGEGEGGSNLSALPPPDDDARRSNLLVGGIQGAVGLHDSNHRVPLATELQWEENGEKWMRQHLGVVYLPVAIGWGSLGFLLGFCIKHCGQKRCSSATDAMIMLMARGLTQHQNIKNKAGSFQEDHSNTSNDTLLPNRKTYRHQLHGD